ncbi:ATP-binding protein, partial [Streptomyces bobili]|uniref:ATP-binding protein n=1 Tax=Streptomyces bobili TaxID=67280 RepID=UPI0037A218B3
MSTKNGTNQARASRDVGSELIYLTKALKAPALRDAAARLAERARDEGWSHEEYLAACLQREVAARDSHGAEGRIRAARFPSRKSLEDFDFDHQRSVKREVIAHLGTLDFVACPGTRLSAPPSTKLCAPLLRPRRCPARWPGG